MSVVMWLLALVQIAVLLVFHVWWWAALLAVLLVGSVIQVVLGATQRRWRRSHTGEVTW